MPDAGRQADFRSDFRLLVPAFFGGTPPSTVFAGKAQISLTTQRGHSGLRALHT